MRLRLHLSLCIFLLLFHLTLINAQDVRFTSYTVSNGLTNNAIRKIYQDSQGFIWVATWEGLSKYDGYRFTNYTTDNGMPHSMINDVVEIAPGNLLVAMNDGSISSIKNGRPETIVKKGNALNRFHYTKNRQLLGLADNAGIFNVSSTGVQKLYSPDTSSLMGIIETRNGDYLAIADKFTVIAYDHLFRPGGKTLLTGKPTPNAILEDHQGNIWIGTDAGLYLLPPDTKLTSAVKWSPLPAIFHNTALATVTINDILEDTDHTLWFGTNEGLYKVTVDEKIELFSENDGLPSRKVTSIFVDREKNLWIGTFAGLAKLALPAIHKVKIPGEDLQNHLYTIHKAGDDELITITENAVYSFRRSNQSFHEIFPLQRGNIPQAVIQIPGFSMFAGKRYYEYDTLAHRFSENVAFRTDYGFFRAVRNDRIFVYGMGGELIIVCNGRDSIRTLAGHRINNLLLDDKNRIWVGTWSTGLFRITLDEQASRIIKTEDLSQYSGDLFIRSLFKDSEHNVWVGTRYNGITVFPANEDPSRRQFLNHQNGLVSNFIYCFEETRPGNIWVATLGGINKIVRENGKYRVFNFSRVNNYHATVNSMVAVKGDEVWCTSDKGLFVIRDNYMERNPPMAVKITNIQLGKSTVNYAEQGLTAPIKLKYNQTNTKFEFTAPGFINEAELVYSYRLIGSGDTSWSEPSNTHSVQYASLKPGNYRFEVMMTGWNGKTGSVTDYPFIIKPPIWQTTWFRLLAIGLFAMLFYLFYRYRIRQLLKLQQVRNNIATDLHDDIGSTLTNISILSELTRKNLQQPMQAEKYIQRITEEVTTSGQALDDIIWSVNSKNDTLEETLVRMRRFAAELFDQTSTLCYLELQPDAAGKKLSMEQRRDLYLVYKESLNNIYKHAAAQSVHIDLSMAGNSVKLLIRDDGSGFDPEAITRGNGLINLRTRIEKWKGKITITSAPGKGSDIEIIMPVT